MTCWQRVLLCSGAEGCKKHATFGKRGGRPVFCGTHKADGMEDLRNKRSEQGACTLVALCLVHGVPV